MTALFPDARGKGGGRAGAILSRFWRKGISKDLYFAVKWKLKLFAESGVGRVWAELCKVAKGVKLVLGSRSGRQQGPVCRWGAGPAVRGFALEDWCLADSPVS